MGRRGRAIILCLFAAMLVVAAAAVWPWDATTLGRAVLARGAALTGGRLTARAFHLRPATGLVIEGLEGAATFTGGSAAFRVDRLVLDHQLWRLFRGELAVERLILRRPHIRLTETASAKARAAGAAPAAGAALGRLALRVSRIDLEDGTIEVQALGEPKPVVVSGLDLSLRGIAFDAGGGTLLGALRGSGEVHVDEVAFARSRARDIRGALRVGGGHLTTDAVRFQTPQGPFEAKLDAQLDRLPFSYTLSLHGNPLDVRAMLAGSASGPGPGSLRLEGRGRGTEAAGLTGSGVVRLETGTLPATPLLKAVERVLGRTRLVGARYEATEAPFRVEGGRVRLDRLRVRSEQVALDVAGWASFAGPLELTLGVRTPRQGLVVEGVGAGVLDLMTDDEGQVVVPLKVTGTQDQPQVRPDAAALAVQARRSGTRTLLDKAGRGLGGLLRGKDRPR